MAGPAPRAFGRYEVLQEIGGSATTVRYRARDPALDRTVVVRVFVPPDGVTEGDLAAFEARFLAEARRAALLVHPALVTTHDCGKDPLTGALFVVEEEVDGTLLERTLVPGEPRPWTEALNLACQVGRGLQKLHESGIVHEAVGPGAILVLASGACKLSRPGIAPFESSQATRTLAAQALGSVLYLSPEQAVGERVDHRSDIFSLGAVTYRLLTGRDAFEDDGNQKILARVLHDRPAPPSQMVPGLPQGVDAVLARTLAKARKDRYADARSLCDDLEDLLAGRAPRNATAAPAQEATWRFLPAGDDEIPAAFATATGWRRPDRRHVVRGLVGLVALGLVVGAELLRRELETPGASPAGPPTPDLSPRRDVSADTRGAADLPPLEPPSPPPSTRLLIDFRHTLESGTLVVSVDGATVLERRVTGAVTKSFLGIKLRGGSLRQAVGVSPGRHVVAVKVRWGDDERSESIAGTFAAGATRRLSANLARVGKRLSVEWQ
jgi:eukaryotic-like serine/threonine-protein kinase